LPPRNTAAAFARSRAQADPDARPFQEAPPPLTLREKGRITVDLNTPADRDLYRDLNIAARVHGVKVAELVRTAMRSWLADHPVNLGNQYPRITDSQIQGE
jgi:hypothetical protein